MLVTVNTAGSAADAQANGELLERLRARLRAVPGVTGVSHVMPPPFAWGTELVNHQSSRGDGDKLVLADRNLVGPDYLATLGVRPLLGRDLSTDDRAGARKVAIVNLDLAEALWPGQPAVGKTMQVGGEPQPLEVVGVAPNGIFGSFHEEQHPGFFFVPEAQAAGPAGEITFYVRFAGSLDAAAPAVRGALHDADARVPIVYMRSMQTQWEGITGPVLLIATLLTLFSAGSLLVAAIGLYAVVAFNMARRTRDFGVRIALGASPIQIRGMVIREGLMMTALGLACGFALSATAGAVLRSRLAGVTPTDYRTYAAVFGLLASAALLACYVPALRAARVSPMEALRQE